ncbi:hypothetical protein VTH06DRAFT_1416 [Thermothelomyces fergusii]
MVEAAAGQEPLSSLLLAHTQIRVDVAHRKPQLHVPLSRDIIPPNFYFPGFRKIIRLRSPLHRSNHVHPAKPALMQHDANTPRTRWHGRLGPDDESFAPKFRPSLTKNKTKQTSYTQDDNEIIRQP